MEREKLKEYVMNGVSLRKIAETYGVSRETVRYYVHKYSFNELYLKPKREHLYLDKIDTIQKAYFLGFMLADGSIDNKDMVSITTAIKDICVIEYLNTLLGVNLVIDKTFDKKNRRFPKVTVSRKIPDIRKFTSGRLKNDRHYPIISNELERYMLLGFFDGDGCITYGYRKDRNRLWHKISFTSSLSILTGVQQLLYKKVGISTILRKKSGEDCYILEFANKKDIVLFFNFIYPNDSFIVLGRKYDKIRALRLELEELGEGSLEK